MALIDKYTTSNVSNSLATYFAERLLVAGYLVYWHHRDMVQTTDGTYYQYSTSYVTYLADPTFLSRYSAAKGIVTITDHVPAVPRHIIRPTTDGSVGPAESVTVPVLSIEIGDAVPLASYEAGSSLKWRTRHLVIDGYARSKDESARLADLLAVWFDEEVQRDVNDHDAGTQAVVGPIRVADMRVDRADFLDEAEERRFEVLLNARLEYVA